MEHVLLHHEPSQHATTHHQSTPPTPWPRKLQGAFTPEIEADLKDLSQIFTLAPKEAADLRAEVAAGLYRRLLKDEVTSKRIDAAASPAQVIACGFLCQVGWEVVCMIVGGHVCGCVYGFV
jgi:hypothetical protein